MGLFDQLLGGVLGGAAGSPVQGVLASLLGGNQQNQAVPGQQPGLAGGLGGVGIAGLLTMFQQAGLGNVIQSWISNGPNHPVSPDQLQSVLGQDQVQTMASQAGMEPQNFLSQLSQHLPNAVNAMTPNGQLPEEGSASV